MVLTALRRGARAACIWLALAGAGCQWNWDHFDPPEDGAVRADVGDRLTPDAAVEASDAAPMMCGALGGQCCNGEEQLACRDGSGCAGGTCQVCSGGWVACEGTCVDLQSSRTHCGGCGQRCERNLRCVAGHCM